MNLVWEEGSRVQTLHTPGPREASGSQSTAQLAQTHDRAADQRENSLVPADHKLIKDRFVLWSAEINRSKAFWSVCQCRRYPRWAEREAGTCSPFPVQGSGGAQPSGGSSRDGAQGCKNSILGCLHGELGSSWWGLKHVPHRASLPTLLWPCRAKGWPSFAGVLLPARDLLCSGGRAKRGNRSSCSWPSS